MSHCWKAQVTNYTFAYSSSWTPAQTNILSVSHIADHILFVSASYENPKKLDLCMTKFSLEGFSRLELIPVLAGSPSICTSLLPQLLTQPSLFYFYTFYFLLPTILFLASQDAIGVMFVTESLSKR